MGWSLESGRGMREAWGKDFVSALGCPWRNIEDGLKTETAELQ